MTTPIFIVILLMLLSFSCKQGDKTDRIESISDTTFILRKAVAMGADGAHMPGASPLGQQGCNSFFLTSSSLPLKYLREDGALKNFIIISVDSVCSRILAEGNPRRRNYLNVREIEKSDTGYYVQMASLACEHFAGGGVLSLYFKKFGDSLVIVNQGSSSIN